jgi:RimJ/RimL family protein N-acetyltransferase
MKQLELKNGEMLLIRQAVKSDAKELVAYVNSISGESDNLTFGPGEFGMSIEQEETYLDNVSKQNNAIYLIAVIGEKIVGSLNFSCGVRPRIVHTGEFGVSTSKAYWGYGIGSELIKYLIEWSKESGIVRKINLRVRTDNAAAIHLYKKLGFIEEGVKTRDFLIQEKFYDSLLMGLTID